MNHCITVVRFFTDRTIITCHVVPNWVERVVLRRKRHVMNYVGHKRTWWQGEGTVTNMKKSGWARSFKLWAIERNLLKVAKHRGVKTLRFA